MAGATASRWSDTDEIFELEIDLEKKAVKWARARGWFSRKYRSPGHRASPDRIFIRRGRVFFVEFKRLGNAPTRQQEDEIESLLLHGADVVWLDSLEDFKAVILGRENAHRMEPHR